MVFCCRKTDRVEKKPIIVKNASYTVCYIKLSCAICYDIFIYFGFCYMLFTIEGPLPYAIRNPLGPYLWIKKMKKLYQKC